MARGKLGGAVLSMVGSSDPAYAVGAGIVAPSRTGPRSVAAIYPTMGDHRSPWRRGAARRVLGRLRAPAARKGRHSHEKTHRCRPCSFTRPTAGSRSLGGVARARRVQHTAVRDLGQNGMWNNGGYIVHNNMWNVSGYDVSETLTACSHRNWAVTDHRRQRSGDGAVKTYPNVHKDYHDWSTAAEPRLSSFRTSAARSPRAPLMWGSTTRPTTSGSTACRASMR